MEKTVLIELTNQASIRLLREMEALNLIKVLEGADTTKAKLSNKYRGMISREKGQQLNEHIQQMRSEWNDT